MHSRFLRFRVALVLSAAALLFLAQNSQAQSPSRNGGDFPITCSRRRKFLQERFW